MSDELKENQNSEVLFYELDTENFRMEVQTDGDTVWLTQQQMAERGEKSKATIKEQIKNVFA